MSDIAIVGMACTFPAARRAGDFWQNIIAKLDAITEVDPKRWDPDVFYDPDPSVDDRLYCKKGGWIPESYSFNPLRFGIPPNSIQGAEPDHCLLFRCVFEALEDAGYIERDYDRKRVSVVIGKGNYVGPGLMWVTNRTVIVEMVVRVLKQMRPDLSPAEVNRLRAMLRSKLPRLTPESAGGVIPNISTGRVANRLDFMGRNFTVDAACASTLVAAEIAVNNLVAGIDDMSIIGGIHIYNEVPFLAVFKVSRAISLTSMIRPFDAQADGTMCGEGVGSLVLKRLEDAERDGDRIYAIIKGVGIASDGKAKAVMAPRLEGEVLAIERAFEMAKIPPQSVELIECHGTATTVGDATELEALESVYGKSGDGRPACAIGSVKSMIGHAMPASGSASLIKTALALYDKILPPTLNVGQPHPALRKPDARFYVNTEPRPWIHAEGGAPRRAAVSAFGFGGINGHVLLEEYTKPQPPNQTTYLREWKCEVLVIEAAGREALPAALKRLRSYVVQVEGIALRDVAYTLNSSLSGLPHRVVIVADSLEDLARKIDRACERLSDPLCNHIRDRGGIYYFGNDELRNARVAFLFPGEGSQYIGMLAELCMAFPEVRECFDRADAVARDSQGTPLSAILYPPPRFSQEEEAADEARLWSVERATESVLTAGGAVFTLLGRLGIRADMMTGHSAGEWIAMAASGMVDIPEFVSSLNRLGDMYRNLAGSTEIPKMAMLAVGAGRERTLELAAQVACPVEVANDNCPHQVIAVTNPADAQRFTDHVLKSGIMVERLPYDRGYHTSSFTYICEPLSKYFQSLNIRPPESPIYSCTTAEPYSNGREAIIDTVAHTFARPLLFRQTVEKMYEDGARIFIESGPRGNLTAFVDDILRGRPHLAVPMDVFHRPGITSLNHAVALLAAAQVPLDFTPLYERRAPRKLSFDAKTDSVLPEEKQPGVMQISVSYRMLEMDSGSEFPMPKAQPAPVNGKAVLSSEPVANWAAPNGIEFHAAAAASSFAEPASSMWLDHFSLMENFLRTEEEIISRALMEGTPLPPVTALQDYASPTSVPVSRPPVAPPPAPVEIAIPVEAPVIRPAAPAVSTNGDRDPKKLVLKVVSERTGYPEEMLGLDQDMEADLGIDSIKRVEIFGALRELSVNGALSSESDMESIGKLKTLRDVLAFLTDKGGANGAATLPIVAVPVSPGAMLHAATTIEETPKKSIRLRLALDLDEHRYLRDHSLYFYATERDNQADRIFVMPLAGSIELMCETAVLLDPGAKVTGVKSVQVIRPIRIVENQPATSIEITARRSGQNEISASVLAGGGEGAPFCTCTVILEHEYAQPPAPVVPDLVDPRAPKCTGREVYTQHWLFHGPSFQGINNIEQVAENGVIASLEILPNGDLYRSTRNPRYHIDPHLLDAAGQLLGYWPVEFLPQGCVTLPMKIASIAKYRENPPAGSILPCRMRVREVNQRTILSDFDVLHPDGTLWIRITGWEDWRFFWTPRFFDCWRFANTEYCSTAPTISGLENTGIQCRHLSSTADYENDSISEDSFTHIVLDRMEFAEYYAHPVAERLPYMFVRATIKEAVRAWIKQNHQRDLYPADIHLAPLDGTRFRAEGFWADAFASPQVSICVFKDHFIAVAGRDHSAVAAVAADDTGGDGSFIPDELDRLNRLPGSSEWKARAVAAKMAAAAFLRPSPEPGHWRSLVIKKIFVESGNFAVADPDMAINAEDAVTVATGRYQDIIVGVAVS